jgi:caffeoyl-CoA O-methyltransferase
LKDITTEEISKYSIDKSTVPSATAHKLELATKESVDMSMMLCGQLEGSVLGLITRLVGAKRVLEFGTFTGYSALVFAENLPDGGEVHTIDVNPETVNFGLEIIKESEHANKIHSHIGSGLEVANELPGEFDIVFIDADKVNYLNYFKIGAGKLAPGGAIIVDNALWSGQVANEEDQSDSTKAIRELNDYIAQSNSFYGTLLPIRDGIFVAIKQNDPS